MTRNTSPAAVVLSLGAGVQSSTASVKAAYGELGRPVTFGVFADTQHEPPSVYDWLEQLRAIVAAAPHPFPIISATQGDLRAASTRLRTSKKTGQVYMAGIVPALVLHPGGTFGNNDDYGILGRRCTRDFKIRVVNRVVRKQLGWHGKRTPKGAWVEMLMGISTDEAIRMKPSPEDWVQTSWPLIDARMSRQDCLDYMAARGWEPPRSACYFCPFHSPKEWHRLQTEEPESYAEAVAFECELQRAAIASDAIDGTPYLTKRGPLADIDWSEIAKEEARSQSWQLDLFGNECEGMCGI